ncbi:MAG: protein TonB [Bacteroidia bacterium]|jgi:protein TonB
MKFNIPNPCSEDWNKMKIGLNARHCDSCEKDVIDFTQQSREEILTYLLMHNGERVCGHIRRSQLDFTYNEIMFVINGMTTNEKKSNLPFYILCMGALLLSSCKNGTTTGKIDSTHVMDSIVQTDSHLVHSRKAVQDTLTKDTIVPKEVEKIGKIIQPAPLPVGIIMTGEVIEGDIDFDPQEIIDGDMEMEIVEPEEEILQFAEVMPEFPGGINALMTYLKANVKYPPLEKENGIQGTLVAEFVVTELGNIENVKIVRSLQGAPTFNQEVIRVINTMPNWKPGTQSGKPVKVRYHLPVTFKLY